MDEQLIAVGLIVAGAVAYLGRATWRMWAGKGGGCGKKCACGPTEEAGPRLIPSEELTLRVRSESSAERPAG
jgi:hypothetical protein